VRLWGPRQAAAAAAAAAATAAAPEDLALFPPSVTSDKNLSGSVLFFFSLFCFCPSTLCVCFLSFPTVDYFLLFPFAQIPRRRIKQK
jgi:hypothetical protein